MNSLVIKITIIIACISVQEIHSQSIENFNLPKKGICAHRGAMNTHPENTISAFNEAIRLGAHMIEFDVRMTKDGHLIIIHDKSVDRTTNGSGLVKDMTLKEIKKLDAGAWMSQKFKGEKIPTLREALQNMPHDIWLNIHLKGGYSLGKETALVLQSENRIHQGVIACENEAAKAVAQVNSNIMICNMERQGNRTVYVEETIKKEYSFIQLLKRRNDKDLKNDIKTLKKESVFVNYFYGDTANEVEQLFDLGVDFVLTNELDKMLNVAESKGVERISR